MLLKYRITEVFYLSFSYKVLELWCISNTYHTPIGLNCQWYMLDCPSGSSYDLTGLSYDSWWNSHTCTTASTTAVCLAVRHTNYSPIMKVLTHVSTLTGHTLVVSGHCTGQLCSTLLLWDWHGNPGILCTLPAFSSDSSPDWDLPMNSQFSYTTATLVPLPMQQQPKWLSLSSYMCANFWYHEFSIHYALHSSGKLCKVASVTFIRKMSRG